jgi:N-acyl-D-amino-acid deacylase
VNATDPVGSTTLMWAAYDEAGRIELVNEMLKIGVNPAATNKMGETALTWALRRGNTPIVDRLREVSPASEDARIRPAVEKAIALLQKSGKQFQEGSGCSSCHHQFVPQMAMGFARKRGFTVDEVNAKEQLERAAGMFRNAKLIMLNEPEHLPDPTISVTYGLLGLAAENYPADDVTDAAIHLISQHQNPDGSFRVFPMRPPIESSQFSATALSIRAFQVYGNGKKNHKQIAQAREWLLTARPQTNEDAVMQLLGIGWSHADAGAIQKAAKGLIAKQRPDGGWAQLPSLESDAYATGQALFALRNAGKMDPSDPVYQRGIDYLLRTQLADGSWHVRSRSFPIQKYRESGFPHGKDQWISASGTGWAAIALSLAK